MAYCGNCGTEVEDGLKFCTSCGEATSSTSPEAAVQPQASAAQTPEAKDAADNKVMAILAYIIVLIPLFAGPKDSKFLRYHTNQGLILLLLGIAYGIAYWILTSILFFISWGLALVVGTILGYASWLFLVLCVIGIVNVAKGEMKPLPVIGKYKILK